MHYKHSVKHGCGDIQNSGQIKNEVLAGRGAEIVKLLYLYYKEKCMRDEHDPFGVGVP